MMCLPWPQSFCLLHSDSWLRNHASSLDHCSSSTGCKDQRRKKKKRRKPVKFSQIFIFICILIIWKKDMQVNQDSQRFIFIWVLIIVIVTNQFYLNHKQVNWEQQTGENNSIMAWGWKHVTLYLFCLWIYLWKPVDFSMSFSMYHT